MKKEEKLLFQKEHHYQEFAATYKQVDQEFQEAHRLYCICGCINSGLHEIYCKRAREYKYSKVIERLSHHLPDKKK